MKPNSIWTSCSLVAISSLLSLAACEETCGDCMGEKCSDLISYCNQDTDCKCMTKCLKNKGIPGVDECLTKCDIAERPPAFVPVEECVALACPDEDECSTPGDYSPPDIPSSDNTADLEDHGGGGGLDDCSFDDGLSFDGEGSVLQLESQNGNVCLRLERQNMGTGNLANTEWKLLEMHVGPLGGVSLVDAPENLCWYSSHHNFLDWAHAWTGEVHYDLKLRENRHGGARTYALHPYEQGPLEGACAPTTDGTTPIGDPITMYPYEP